MSHNKKIFIVSGGTGGHIIPARCLAEELSQNNHQAFFFGDKKYHSYIKKEDGFKSTIIACSSLEKKPIKLLIAAIKISLGALQSLYYFLRFRPKYIVAFGGYATFPMLAAALITRTKIILHEQNAHLGKVNRLFAKYACKIALSFQETSGIAPCEQNKLVFVGNPVRKEILQLHEISYHFPEHKEPTLPNNRLGYDVILASDFHYQEKEELFNILVIGGSGGAKIFSEILPKAFFNFSEDLKAKIAVVQQCRSELLQSTFDQYSSFNLNIEIEPFFNDMPEKIKAAHLVIARSGSSSIFEFCAAKKPMILVPFAKAADNHQEKNARYLEKNGAAIVITENEFTINKINELLKNLITNQSLLEKMSRSAGNLATLNATQNLAKLVSN